MAEKSGTALIHDLMEKSEPHINIVNAWAKTWDILGGRFYRPACSISGGSDSDIMLHMIHTADVDRRVKYLWFNTGLEYQATQRHIEYLKDLYDTDIITLYPIKPIGTTLREYGYPFLSKIVSARIHMLQRKGFDFTDKRSYEEDLEAFPKCKDGINWWHSKFSFKTWNINRHKLLKEFLVAHPPVIPISDKCCEFTKKRVGLTYNEKNYVDLTIIGTRKAEGGIRQVKQSCFEGKRDGTGVFRPLFWFLKDDKIAYEQIFNVTHSDCYTQYGLTRTGCAGCPFNPHVEKELEVIRQYEEPLYHAAHALFEPSYEYTRLYRQFVNEH